MAATTLTQGVIGGGDEHNLDDNLLLVRFAKSQPTCAAAAAAKTLANPVAGNDGLRKAIRVLGLNVGKQHGVAVLRRVTSRFQRISSVVRIRHGVDHDASVQRDG